MQQSIQGPDRAFSAAIQQISIPAILAIDSGGVSNIATLRPGAYVSIRDNRAVATVPVHPDNRLQLGIYDVDVPLAIDRDAEGPNESSTAAHARTRNYGAIATLYVHEYDCIDTTVDHEHVTVFVHN